MPRKFIPVAARRSSSGAKRRASPCAASRRLVTCAEATNAGSSEGKRLPSASRRSVRRLTGPWLPARRVAYAASASAGGFERRLWQGRLEELDGVARGVLEQDLLAADA